MAERDHLYPTAAQVTRAERARAAGQRGCVVWFTGLSGSGKSTLARALEAQLIRAGRVATVLDGDNIRAGLNRDLGFGPDDRRENIRRIAEVARLCADASVITITAFISPYIAERRAAREIIGAARFIEVFVDAPIEVCEQRDPKQLYAKARRGEIAEFTGVSAPYEPPLDAELVIRTAEQGLSEGVECAVALLGERGFISPGFRVEGEDDA
jgi:adenylylsulfate kinase